MMIEQSIRDTLNSYADHDNNATAYDELTARMHEAMTAIREARLVLHAAMIETTGPKNQSPFVELAKVDALLGFALTAWED